MPSVSHIRFICRFKFYSLILLNLRSLRSLRGICFLSFFCSWRVLLFDLGIILFCILFLFDDIRWFFCQIKTDPGNRFRLSHLNELCEQLLDVLASFGWDLEIRKSQFLSFFLSVLLSNVSILKINFIANQKGESFTGLVFIVQIEPWFSTVERGSIGDIEYNKSTFCIFQVVGNQRSETFLSSSIPKLQSIWFIINDHIFD